MGVPSGSLSLSTLASLPGFLCPCVGSRALAGLLPLEAVTLYAVGLSVARCEVFPGWLVFYLLRSDPLYMRHFCPVGFYKNMRKSTANRTHQQHQPPGLVPCLDTAPPPRFGLDLPSGSPERLALHAIKSRSKESPVSFVVLFRYCSVLLGTVLVYQLVCIKLSF